MVKIKNNPIPSAAAVLSTVLGASGSNAKTGEQAPAGGDLVNERAGIVADLVNTLGEGNPVVQEQLGELVGHWRHVVRKFPDLYARLGRMWGEARDVFSGSETASSADPDARRADPTEGIYLAGPDGDSGEAINDGLNRLMMAMVAQNAEALSLTPDDVRGLEEHVAINGRPMGNDLA